MTFRLLAPAILLLASSACFATRNDVRILQGDIFALKTQQASADSARAKQLADIAASLATNVATVRDSVRMLGDRLTTFQGGTRQVLSLIEQQLSQIGERLGQSQTALARFRADIEDQNRQFMQQAVRTAPPAVVGDSTKPPTPVAPLSEGPNVLYQAGREQLLQNSWSSAREAFNKLITDHPTSPSVPLAMFGIAESYDGEGNRAQGDSVFRLVHQKYPLSEVAPRALYKLALSLAIQRKRADAQLLMRQVVRDYPRSDEAALASDWLGRNPG